jgi:4-diphosphocytidyl-2-C-methyl-D-erythritol kinase
MVTFPHCKINLGLNILRKREDNFHDIETAFFPLPFYDVLEIVSAENEIQFINTGISGGAIKNNLCIKAYQLLKKDFPGLPKIKMHLHKTIPAGAGLGAGSADGAFTLSLLNKKYQLNISQTQLSEYALQLGSDCPFFLMNKPAIAAGRGEQLEGINLSLAGYKIIIINPAIHISTREVFQQIVPAVPAKRIKNILQQPIDSWKNDLVNDFEKIVFKAYPQIKTIKDELYQNGALYASMTGTGSTVFGIFTQSEEVHIPNENGYLCKAVENLA